MYARVPQEPREASRLPPGEPAGGTGQAEAPGPRGERSAAQGANTERPGGTAERRQRSEAGRSARSRSAAYERGRGGTDPRDPAERRAAPCHGTVGGKDGGAAVLRGRLHETRTGSKAGEGSSRHGVPKPRP